MTGDLCVRGFYKETGMSSEKISVFGGTGFIGGRFCEKYNNNAIKIPRDSRVPQSKQVLYLISTIHNYNVFDDPHLDINTNLTTLIETLEQCKGTDAVFNFVSSWFVYGQTKDLPADEGSNCNPRGFYSITKRCAEQLLISYCETFNIKYRIFRLSNVYGVNATKVSIKRNALQYLANEIVQGRDINLYNAGSDIRDYMHVDDTCRAMMVCMDSAPLNEIINIGSGTPQQIGQVMNYVKEKTKSKSELVPVTPPDFHKKVQVKDMYLDITKLKSLDFTPEKDFWNQIDRIIDISKENGE